MITQKVGHRHFLCVIFFSSSYGFISLLSALSSAPVAGFIPHARIMQPKL